MNVLTRSEYNKIVEYIVAEERERLTESINAVFEREGQNRDALIHAAVKQCKASPPPPHVLSLRFSISSGCFQLILKLPMKLLSKSRKDVFLLPLLYRQCKGGDFFGCAVQYDNCPHLFTSFPFRVWPPGQALAVHSGKCSCAAISCLPCKAAFSPYRSAVFGFLNAEFLCTHAPANGDITICEHEAIPGFFFFDHDVSRSASSCRLSA